MNVVLTSPLVAWLLTYALHSTVLGLAIVVLVRVPGLRGSRETLVRCGLVGALLTTSAVTWLGGSWWSLGASPSAQVGGHEELGAVRSSEALDAGVVTTASRVVRTEEVGATSSRITPQPRALTTPSWQRAVRVAWWMTGTLTVWFVLSSWWRGRVSRRGRSSVPSTWRDELAELAAKARLRRVPRLFVHSSVRVPVVVGGWRPMLLVPETLRVLEDDQRRAVFAHEVAHVARGDAWWCLAQCVVCGLFWFQPLHWWAARRLRCWSEEACDDWAARVTGDRLAVASCLVEVARWTGPRTPRLHCAMARSRAGITARVERLLEPTPPSTRRRAGWSVGVLATAACSLAPSFAAVPPPERMHVRSPATLLPLRPSPTVNAAWDGVQQELIALEAELTSLREASQQHDERFDPRARALSQRAAAIRGMATSARLLWERSRRPRAAGASPPSTDTPSVPDVGESVP